MSKDLRDWRISEEIQLRLLETMGGFKSKEHPRAKITKLHYVRALSSLLYKTLTQLK